MSWGVVAHAPVAIAKSGEPTCVEHWEDAFQCARKIDAEALKRMCEARGLNTYGWRLHVVDLGD